MHLQERRGVSGGERPLLMMLMPTWTANPE
jgi:hypothetical protein